MMQLSTKSERPAAAMRLAVPAIGGVDSPCLLFSKSRKRFVDCTQTFLGHETVLDR